MAKHILLLNGPNLNLLGHREPHLYGHTTLTTLHASLRQHCVALGTSAPALSCYQSNHEGAILDVIHSCHPVHYTLDPEALSLADGEGISSSLAPNGEGDGDANENANGEDRDGNRDGNRWNGKWKNLPRVDAIIINAGGLTHTSVVLRDALVGVGIPFVEVHVTNVHARDAFRHRSFLSEKAQAVISGLGVFGYRAAVDYFVLGSERAS